MGLGKGNRHVIVESDPPVLGNLGYAPIAATEFNQYFLKRYQFSIEALFVVASGHFIRYIRMQYNPTLFVLRA